MTKTFKLLNLDCAHCAAKMEAAIKKLDNVNDARISFLTQKLTLDADDQSFDEVVEKAAACCKKIEPDCVVVVK